MKFFSSLGFLSLITALIIIAYEMFRWLTGITGKPVVHVNAVMVLILIGAQFFFFGLLAELMVLLNRKR